MALVALTASLVAIGYLLMRKVNTGLAMITGAVVLCIAGGMPVRELGGAMAATLVDPTTVNLILSVLLLGALGHAMKLTGSLSRSVEALERLAGAGRLALVSVPALVSMLAVPGGAILSAPMVHELGRRQGLVPEKLSALNIFYRHVVYFTFPLFPSLLLACELAGVSVYDMARYNLPAILIGGLAAVPLLRVPPAHTRPGPGPQGGHEASSARWGGLLALLWNSLPIWVILAGSLGLKWPYPLSILLALVTAVLSCPGPRGARKAVLLQRCREVVLRGISWPTVLTVFGIMFFKEVLGREGSIDDLTLGLLEAGIPLPAILACVPFLVSFLVGDNAAAVGIVFPLLLPLLGGTPAYGPAVAALYGVSTGAHILSPIHPCVALSNEYFRVPYGAVIRLILPPTLAATAASYLGYLLFR